MIVLVNAFEKKANLNSTLEKTDNTSTIVTGITLLIGDFICVILIVVLFVVNRRRDKRWVRSAQALGHRFQVRLS